jgi:hypothetical protein
MAEESGRPSWHDASYNMSPMETSKRHVMGPGRSLPLAHGAESMFFQ